MTDAIHVRTIRVEAARVGDCELEVTGRLVDDRPQGSESWFGRPYGPTIHDMSLTLRVRYPDLVITGVGGSMAAHPYVVCPDAVPRLDRLVGLSVARGFTRALNERLGRQQGCAHLTALIHAMAPVVRQGAGAAFGEQADVPRPGRDRWFVDTCQAWRADGALADRLRAGDLEGLQALSTPRPDPAA
jgi:hypothetical protein